MIYAYILDLVLGDPQWFYHPIRVIGNIISAFGKHFYRDSYLRGLLLLLTVLLTTTVILLTFRTLSIHFDIYNWYLVFFLYTSLATKSLVQAVLKVSRKKSIKERRKELSYIVSRNTENLDDNSINRSLVETVSENTIDGIISPLFYILMGYLIGYPVITVYLFKAVSTLDSMVGYKNDKYRKYGYFSAKTDDILNFIPARVGSMIMLLAGAMMGKNILKGFRTYLNFRCAHDSPNAGHPESMMAGLIDVRLGGPNIYHGVVKEKPYIGNGSTNITKRNVIDSCIITVMTSLITFGGIVWILSYMELIQNVL